MSQHSFSTTFEARPVEILMGWDRPLQGFFMTIFRKDAGRLQSEFVYCNLDDEALIDCGGLPPTLDHFVATLLVGYGIRLPQSMIDEVNQDARDNVGNRYVMYDAAGRPETPR